MRAAMGSLFLVIVCFCPGHCSPQEAAEEVPLQVGVASADITPPLGMPMAGYYSTRLATGIHDRLHAKAIYIRGRGVEVLWVFCDLIGIDRQTVLEARKRIKERLGLPGQNVLIAATHTHTGPLYYGARPGSYSSARSDLSSMQRDYIEQLIEGIARSAQKAKASASPSTVSSASGSEGSLSFNRRFHMKSGEVRFNPGRGNPNILRPAGPIDPEVSVLCFRPVDDSNPSAVLVAFALHLDTVGGRKFSADFPYFMGEVLRKEYGRNTLPIFGMGTSGDINHIDVNNQNQLTGIKGTQLIGERLASDVLGAIEKERRVEPAPVLVATKILRVPLQKHSPEDVEESRQILQKGKGPFLDRVRAHKILSLKHINADFLDLEIQVFRVGDVALVALPGEIFVELGLFIKKHSPFAATIVVELANDSIAYVPTRKGFSEGSYEVVNSLVAPGGGELMAEAALGLLRRLNRE